MVRIDKTQVRVPTILDTGGRGEIATEVLKADAVNGTIDFSFSSSIYGHVTVKEALKIAQHKKCCFCESKISHVSHGDVEHFRPKGGFIGSLGQFVKPGYYWLAYHFPNLYFACQICNQIFKKNYFPLSDEAKRALSHLHDHMQEDALILDPGQSEPAEHLVFEAEIIKPRMGSDKGKETIIRMGLDREDLNESRMEYYRILKILERLAQSNAPESQEAKAAFKEFGQPQSQYSLMVRSNFPDLV